MVQLDTTTTRERILEATLVVLTRSGTQRLSLSDVAATAGVSRPTLYRWFPSKEALLDSFGVYEQDKYDAGIANAVAGLDGEARLDAILRFIVKFQHSSSLRRIVDVEPEHVVYQMNRVMPIMRERLLPHFRGPDGFIVANVVTRIALSHALIPDDDSNLFYAELRHAAGLVISTELNHATGVSRCDRPHRRRSDEPEVARETHPGIPGGEFDVLAPVGSHQSHQTEVVVRRGDPRHGGLRPLKPRRPH